MEIGTIIDAVILGITEGLTEFIPVSSTGHILLLGHFLGFQSTARSFEVLIQLGAILAILAVYFARLWQLFITLPSSPRSRRFVAGIVLAFLPAAFAGVLAHDFIKTVLFETPIVICVALVVGGILLLVVDRMPLTVRYHDVMDYPLSLCLKIGLFQTLALIPGTSRSGATIAGALLMGTDKRSAAEFSFFLAMPTMVGAFTYDLIKNRDLLSLDDFGLIAIGFVMAFLSALVVVRGLLDFVSRHGFAPFAWWRIAVGLAGIVAIVAIG
ncbi:undecaprenyl-diphosphate phosphatase [Aurantimonas sp. C2-6-R+9]|uniref:undecaprenyl-diphosphate phosphatase n=1 Tax=unclassified Aurantimonas TaxID=2638230 RepID=UPI002E180F71|nr:MULTISPECIES: undecaprenyl-diphosphate phosphatase [unclassified Aurantimonas]MEC5291494.1 undecaprenyl-diphosphate phosphatase [Aurantimonas sp. C2-3-R2]MEC5324534.1 undecaprenyl-diphosphate phosphatase [Aurantimonas sp. A3-2-R12]MEC5381642.1 undecaprenyl-diphosphate phosphatase [Aurantimonas sp. C2-6-R+9]MEC5412580.1 undecaprenyl-diphosphate phosphatase [Aurantimonas sp. C2-4-R8]